MQPKSRHSPSHYIPHIFVIVVVVSCYRLTYDERKEKHEMYRVYKTDFRDQLQNNTETMVRETTTSQKEISLRSCSI